MDPNQKKQQDDQAQLVGTVHKERVVSVSPDVLKQAPEVSTKANIEPTIESSEALLKVEEDLQSLIKQEEPKVPHEPQAGITAAAESTPVSTQPTGVTKLPMSEQEATDELKQGKNSFHLEEQLGDKAGIYVEDSKPFLAALVRKFFQSLRLLKRRTA